MCTYNRRPLLPFLMDPKVHKEGKTLRTYTRMCHHLVLNSYLDPPHSHFRVPTQIVFSNSLYFPCPITNFRCDNLKFSPQISQYPLPLESANLQLEQTKFPVFSLCFGEIIKFPVFSLTGFFCGHFPCFSCAVGTLPFQNTVSVPLLSKETMYLDI